MVVILAADSLFSTHANATESPLLRLPPEIRSRIWGFVLGGNRIHACDYKGFATHSLCKAHHLDTSDRFLYRDCITAECENSYRASPKLSPSVLEAWKQVHEEAALLPFTDNIFVFPGSRNMCDFTRHLLLAQKKALTRVSFCVPRAYFIQPVEWNRVEPAKLTGLKHVTVTFDDTSGQSLNSKWGPVSDLRVYLVALASLFEKSPLVTASIHIDETLKIIPRPYRVAETREAYEAVTREMEKLLLKEGEPIATQD